MPTPIGNRILSAIGRRPLAQVAREWGVNRTALYGWINGDFAPGVESLNSISIHLNVPLQDLVSDIQEWQESRRTQKQSEVA